MRKIFIIATLAAFAVGTGSASIASAEGRGGGHGSNQGTQLKGLDRADAAAGAHGAQGRKIGRKHGANKLGFCPPGQAKKPGLGSSFQC